MRGLTKIVQNKAALRFIGKFVILYLVLSTIYALYIQWYYPAADPVTNLVARNTAYLLSFFHDGLSLSFVPTSHYVTILLHRKPILDIFEGCNALNVIIVFSVFIIAFSSQYTRAWRFILLGIVMIYLVNLLRIAVLFWVALYVPSSMYFFHKYFFTAIIYVAVTGLWFLWVKKNNRLESGAAAN